MVTAYEERNEQQSFSTGTSTRKSITVVRKSTWENRSSDTEEWTPRESFYTIEAVIFNDDSDYPYVKINDDLWIDSDNIDMYIQLLGEIKASGILEKPKK